MSEQDWRISDVEKAVVGKEKIWAFDAHMKEGNRFVFQGRFSAPRKTPRKDLWKIAQAKKADSDESTD